ncbi:hypothetical protein Tco_1546186 [Tanacetum coccineum]
MGSEIMASCEDCLDGEEGKSRLEKLVEVLMYSPMEVRKVGRECKKDDEEKIISKMRMSSFYRRILRRDNGEGQAWVGLTLEWFNSLLGEISGDR